MSLSILETSEPAVGSLLVLEDEVSETRVKIAPRRGALVTSLQVRGRELLYLDQDSLHDANKNVRGGIPVLFPSPGKLRDDAFAREGRRGSLKQHGFARNLAFTPSARESEAAEVTLTLQDSEQTRAHFPWPFVLQLHFSVADSGLRIGVDVHNPGHTTLPFAFGLHPYFTVVDKPNARIDTAATRVFDNVTKAQRPFSGFDLAAHELDLHLLDHGSTESTLRQGDGSCIRVRASREFTRWVVWTLAGKDFVCLEPWTAPFDALNSGEGLIHVAPGATHRGFVEFSYTGL